MRTFPPVTPKRDAKILAIIAMLSITAPVAVLSTAKAEALPDPHIAGFTFPEREAVLTTQVTTMTRGASDEERAAAAFRIHQHGWGLWTALTAIVPQSYDGQPLRVFETWTSLEELEATPPSGSDQAVTENAPNPILRHSPRLLRALRLEAEDMDPSRPGASRRSSPNVERMLGFVKFNPPAAAHIQQQQLLRASTLAALLDGGAVQVPPFPATALVVKPVFQVIRTRALVEGRYYALKVWSGPPPTPRPWGPDQWASAVWIDLRGGGMDTGVVDAIGAPDGTTRAAATTYPIRVFLHHRLSVSDAAALNAANPATDASAGDTAILLGMHVAGRELARWTWQTFWWTPDPGNPPGPSSASIAGARPPQLAGAARHYAMALAYTMLSPEQPYVGGSNTTPAAYAYNPWIEARFGPEDLPDSQPGFDESGAPAANNVGVQTNCLSCHAQATYHPASLPTAPRFTGARYVDLIDPQFVGTLQTEFLWSLPRHAQ